MSLPYLNRAQLALPVMVALVSTVAQAQTHLNVPANHILSMQWINTGLDVQYPAWGTWSGMSAMNSDATWMATTAPTGYSIILKELHISAPAVSTASPVLVRLERWDSGWTKLLESIDHTIIIPPNTGYNYKTTWTLETGLVLSPGTHARVTVMQTGSATPAYFGFTGSGYYTTY